MEYKGREDENDKEIELNIFKGEIVGGNLTVNKKDILDAKWFTKSEANSLHLRGEWVADIITL